jgi:WD40 repeat protein
MLQCSLKTRKIECVRFSPDSNFLISLGDPNDRGLFVWDWRNEKKISSNKLSKPALTVAFSPDQDLFVTGGY